MSDIAALLATSVTTEKQKTVSDLFTITYGHSLEYNKFEEDLENGVNFVSRTAKNNGVSGKIKLPEDSSIQPVHGPVITVALGGSVLSTFLQLQPIVCGYHVHILSPKTTMSIEEMLFYCTAIEANKWKYNFGRQANRTLKDLILPDFMPEEWKGKLELHEIDMHKGKIDPNKNAININSMIWKKFRIVDLFHISKGDYKTAKPDRVRGDIPLVTSSMLTNGVTDYVANIAATKKAPTIYPAGRLTFAKDGSVGETFVQLQPFFASSHVNVLEAKNNYSYQTKLFIATVLRQATSTRYSFGYAVSASRFEALSINLPAVEVDGVWVVDDEKIEKFMNTLNWSKVFNS